MIFLKGDIQKEVNNERLKQLLNEREPRIVRFLVRLWARQQSDITYAELREMILTGEIDSEIIEQWYKDYSEFVVQCLMPEWQEMMEESVKEFENRFPVFSFDPSAPEIASYVSQHSAELVTNSASYQIEAIRAMVSRAAVLQDISVDQLAQVIRPVIGLYKGQAVANLNYYKFMRDSLLENNPTMRDATADKRAREAAVKYAEVQHRVRAHMIARTELAFAHNAGEFNAVKQAQSQGFIGRVKKKWITAGDDRVCRRCKALDGVEVDFDDYFPGTNLLYPPFHPRCRCVYDVIEQEDWEENEVIEIDGERI